MEESLLCNHCYMLQYYNTLVCVSVFVIIHNYSYVICRQLSVIHLHLYQAKLHCIPKIQPSQLTCLGSSGGRVQVLSKAAPVSLSSTVYYIWMHNIALHYSLTSFMHNTAILVCVMLQCIIQIHNYIGIYENNST